MFEILDICSDGAGKTKILYHANLNSERVNRYLSSLVKTGLITEIQKGSRVTYKTTYKGIEIKEKFEQLNDEMEDLRAMLG